jgi:AcrR family transcriptional regulator
VTEKKENILEAGLQLFAEEGYASTSTSKVARAAGVSEGLIFRHFTNKEGLLKAIIEEGQQRLKSTFADIVLESDPKKLLAKTIEMPFAIAKDEHTFWKLQFALKWQHPMLYQRISLEAVLLAIANAFKKLNYQHPELEAEVLMITIDGLASALLKGSLTDNKAILDLIKSKYHL